MSRAVPVTILSGFLGAGKTTLLEHALNNTQGRKVAVLVNDMANVNVDAKLIKKQSSKAEGGVVELKNGCICCSLKDSLIKEVIRLAQRSKVPLDCILVEGSGIAEPQPIAQAFADAATDKVKLDTLVTVVDAEKFLRDYQRVQTLGTVKQLVDKEGASQSDMRSIVNLLVDQVELADILVLNKTDLITVEQRLDLESILSHLNPTAKLIAAHYGHVDLDNFLCTGLHKAKENYAVASPYTNGVLRTVGNITSFTYTRTRPMSASRLHSIVIGWDEFNVLRAKGFVWVATRPHRSVFLALAGGHVRLQDGGEWDEEGVLGVGQGAKRQEIVFIGMRGKLNEGRICAVLDSCLLTDEEVRFPEKWAQMADPIVLMPNSWQEVQVQEQAMKKRWVPTAVALAVWTVAFNIIEGAVSIAVGLEQESLGLVGFGFDSVVEVASAAFVLLRLYPEIRTSPSNTAPSRHARSRASATRSERISTIGIGLLLVGLGVGTLIASIINLSRGAHPPTGAAGLAVSCVSLSLMFALWYFKVYVAIVLDSSTLEKDAACSLGCIKLSAVLLIGSALNTASNQKLWWGDSSAALLISLFVLWDGVETVWHATREEFDGCVCCSRGNSWVYGRMYKQLRERNGVLKGAERFAVKGTESRAQEGDADVQDDLVHEHKRQLCADDVVVVVEGDKQCAVATSIALAPSKDDDAAQGLACGIFPEHQDCQDNDRDIAGVGMAGGGKERERKGESSESCMDAKRRSDDREKDSPEPRYKIDIKSNVKDYDRNTPAPDMSDSDDEATAAPPLCAKGCCGGSNVEGVKKVEDKGQVCSKGCCGGKPTANTANESLQNADDCIEQVCEEADTMCSKGCCGTLASKRGIGVCMRQPIANGGSNEVEAQCGMVNGKQESSECRDVQDAGGSCSAPGQLEPAAAEESESQACRSSECCHMGEVQDGGGCKAADCCSLQASSQDCECIKLSPDCECTELTADKHGMPSCVPTSRDPCDQEADINEDSGAGVSCHKAACEDTMCNSDTKARCCSHVTCPDQVHISSESCVKDELSLNEEGCCASRPTNQGVSCALSPANNEQDCCSTTRAREATDCCNTCPSSVSRGDCQMTGVGEGDTCAANPCDDDGCCRDSSQCALSCEESVKSAMCLEDSAECGNSSWSWGSPEKRLVQFSRRIPNDQDVDALALLDTFSSSESGSNTHPHSESKDLNKASPAATLSGSDEDFAPLSASVSGTPPGIHLGSKGVNDTILRDGRGSPRMGDATREADDVGDSLEGQESHRVVLASIVQAVRAIPDSCVTMAQDEAMGKESGETHDTREGPEEGEHKDWIVHAEPSVCVEEACKALPPIKIKRTVIVQV